MKPARPVMIVEDSDEDFEVTCWALEKAGFTGPVIRCVAAEEALSRLCPAVRRTPERCEPAPAVILLDLNLPGMSGIDLLGEVRRGKHPSAVPIVILSTSSNPRDVAACYRLGAAGYLCKPLSMETYVAKLRGLVEYWLVTVTLPPLDG